MILVPQAKVADYTARGWWGERTLWQLFALRQAERGEAEAVVDAPNRRDFAHGEPRRWRWDELRTEVDRFALALLDAGLRKDDVLVSQLPNIVEQFAVYLACARLGVVVTPVPVQYREHELDHIVEVTGAVAAVTLGRIGKPGHGLQAAAMFVGLRHRHPAMRTVLAWGEDLPDGVVDLASCPVPSEGDAARLSQAETGVTANDVFTICWTSGTEARAKGVPRSHNEWLVIAPSIIEAGELQPGARLLNPFPLVNMAGISTAFVTFLQLGGTVVQHHPFSLDVFRDQLAAERIDYTVAPPAVLNTLLQNEDLLRGIDFTRLRRIGSGSAPLSEWMVRGFAERHGVQIVNYFGSNEGASLSGTYLDIPDPALRAAYFPRAGVDGFEWRVSTTRKIRTRLVDVASGEDITEPGRPGELRFRGPTIFTAYWRDEATTARAFDEQGFYKTGDLFEIAGERGQYYRYVGRAKDLVIRGGMNISAEEMEGLLAGCPGVREVAIVGVPDEILGERVCACVVADAQSAGGAPTLATITTYLREHCRVAVYKLPEYLLLVDALPRNPVGKILKRDLRQSAAALAQPTVAA